MANWENQSLVRSRLFSQAGHSLISCLSAEGWALVSCLSQRQACLPQAGSNLFLRQFLRKGDKLSTVPFYDFSTVNFGFM
jgi:hypothetical protein